MKKLDIQDEKRILIEKRKKNAKLYPIYKMFSWDLLFYYAIIFVYLTQTKGLTMSTVLFTDSLYPILKIIIQFPASSIIDFYGKRNSLVFANVLLAICLTILIFANGIIGVLISYFFMAFAFAIKGVAENNLLFDSVTVTKNHDPYTKIDEKGSSNYYFLDGISSLCTGFLYVINGYIPLIISLAFVVISIAISTCFKEIYPPQKQTSFRKSLKNYQVDLKESFQYIINSKRLKALFLFASFFSGLIYIVGTYREGMLVFLGVPAQYFSVILAVLTFICGLATNHANHIHKHFRNRTFTSMILTYVITLTFLGIVALSPLAIEIKLLLALILFTITYCVEGPYYVLRGRYLKSFATTEMRTKIDTAYTIVRSLAEFLTAFLASFLLGIVEVSYASLLTGIVFLFLGILVILYMKPRFGLKPEQYSKKDIQIL